MINKLSTILTNNLLSKGLISTDERDLYIYGLFMLLSEALFSILACLTGIIFKCFFESVIFFISFMLIRRFAGGFHAKTETVCEILSSLAIIGSIALIKLSKIYDMKTALLCIALVCTVVIFILCPLDTPEKPLSDKEFKHFRKISRLILTCIIACALVSFHFKFDIVFTPCCISIILESILITFGKINRINFKTKVNS